jgi:carbonic anhydrase/acetyltransferase-like protein (isoleucine patch superfamily)
LSLLVFWMMIFQIVAALLTFLNAGVTVDHHAQVDSFAHLGVGTCVAGGSGIEEGAWLRTGCAVGYGAEVQAWQIVVPGTVLGD